MKIKYTELSDYIKAVLKGIENGLPETYHLSSPVKFQIGLINVGQKEGGVQLMVAGIGGKRSSEEHARVEFEITNPMAIATKEVWEQIRKGAVESIKDAQNNSKISSPV